jgi:prepilin-type N-terminal cleavage/methylation domain-containing protein
MKRQVSKKQQTGFSTIELMVVVLIAGIVAALAIPAFMQMMRNLRLSGDARSIAEVMGLAKMRAAANFTDARAYFDFGQRSYHVEIWDKENNCWRPDAVAPGAGGGCPPAVGQPLSQTITFGFGAVEVPPPNTQAAIAQAPACRGGLAAAGVPPSTLPWLGPTFENTACVVFNSRGVPIDFGAGGVAPTSQDAIYLTDGNNMVYGVTISQTGAVRTWSTPANAVNWMRR